MSRRSRRGSGIGRGLGIILYVGIVAAIGLTASSQGQGWPTQTWILIGIGFLLGLLAIVAAIVRRR